jgi:hypothetical protein
MNEGTGVFYLIATVSETNYLVTGLTSGSTYEFKV